MRILILGMDRHVTDISVLAELTELEYLELFSCPITDLSPLANHTKLVDLNISKCKIRDLSPLESCTALERMWINQNTKIAQEEIDAFQASHPDCLVSHTLNHETSNGWRKHWRYKQYLAMFRSGQWCEFVKPETAN